MNSHSAFPIFLNFLENYYRCSHLGTLIGDYQSLRLHAFLQEAKGLL